MTCQHRPGWVHISVPLQAQLGAHLSAAVGPAGCSFQCCCGPAGYTLQCCCGPAGCSLQCCCGAGQVHSSVLLRAGRVHSSVLLRGRPGGNFTDTDGTKFCVEHISTGCLPTRPAPQSSYCCSVCIYYKTFVKKYICKFVKMEYESHKGVGCCLFD